LRTIESKLHIFAFTQVWPKFVPTIALCSRRKQSFIAIMNDSCFGEISPVRSIQQATALAKFDKLRRTIKNFLITHIHLTEFPETGEFE